MSDHLNDCDCCQRKLAALRIAGAIDGIHLRQRDAYRDILTDLIAELRGVFGTDAEAYGERIGTFPIGSHGDEVRQYIDRAEVQLRTLQTPGGPAGADLTNGEGSGDA